MWITAQCHGGHLTSMKVCEGLKIIQEVAGHKQPQMIHGWLSLTSCWKKTQNLHKKSPQYVGPTPSDRRLESNLEENCSRTVASLWEWRQTFFFFGQNCCCRECMVMRFWTGSEKSFLAVETFFLSSSYKMLLSTVSVKLAMVRAYDKNRVMVTECQQDWVSQLSTTRSFSKIFCAARFFSNSSNQSCSQFTYASCISIDVSYFLIPIQSRHEPPDHDLIPDLEAPLGRQLVKWHELSGTSTKKVNWMYKVVQIWPGQTVTCLHTISPSHIWTTLYYKTCTNTGRQLEWRLFGERTRYPLYGRLCGLQDQSEWLRKILPSPGFDQWTIQPVVSSCTNRAVPARS
jgi:hypothetical protein